MLSLLFPKETSRDYPTLTLGTYTLSQSMPHYGTIFLKKNVEVKP